MILFLDSSSIVSVYLEDEGRSRVLAARIGQADAACCSVLARVEVASALARALRDGRLATVQHDQVLSAFTAEWPRYVSVPVSDQLLDHAAEMTSSRALKSLDAIQLASAISIRDRVPDVISFSSWDEALRSAAEAEGFELAHGPS